MPPVAPRRIVKKKFFKLFAFLIAYIVILTLLSVFYISTKVPEKLTPEEKGSIIIKPSVIPIPSITQIPITPTPTVAPTITPTPEPPKKEAIATQIDETTWKVELETDNHMATPFEIFQALNTYRNKREVESLLWDETLASFAQNRSDLFNSQGKLDNHAGFRDYMNNRGFEISGFNGLGENSAYMAGPMTGTTIIESLFSADAPHDNNQLDSSWTHVGIGLTGNAVNVNFGKNKR